MLPSLHMFFTVSFIHYYIFIHFIIYNTTGVKLSNINKLYRSNTIPGQKDKL